MHGHLLHHRQRDALPAVGGGVRKALDLVQAHTEDALVSSAVKRAVRRETLLLLASAKT